MKRDIHPAYHKIKVKRTNGEVYETYSTWGKEGETMSLDIDPLTHPAWIGGSAQINQKAGRVAKFNSRYGAMKFTTSASSAS